jgi:hypothetical protein
LLNLGRIQQLSFAALDQPIEMLLRRLVISLGGTQIDELVSQLELAIALAELDPSA